MRIARAVAAVIPFVVACGGTATAPTVPNAPSAPDASPEGPAPVANVETKIEWLDLDDALKKAKAERRYVLLDGAAEWCHWCHVMDQTTYADVAVQRALAGKFVAARVDIDRRPDVEERYSAWGWPATVVFSPDGEELAKYRGYIPPDRFLALLDEVAKGAGDSNTGANADAKADTDAAPLEPRTLTDEALARAEKDAEGRLEAFWDDAHAGWGTTIKAPLWWNQAYALERAAEGDATYRTRALRTLDAEAALVDPVWGGMSQYSTDGDWAHPHYEKLMYMNAGAIDSYARGFALTGDPKYLALAKKVDGYVERFLASPDGGYYATQDADLDAHVPGKIPTPGAAYYALDEKGRLAKGIPRIDTHEYAREQGYAIAAVVELAKVVRGTDGAALLERAKKAATRAVAQHEVVVHGDPGDVGPKAKPTRTGGVTHEAGPHGKTLFLADQAALTWGLAILARATGDADVLADARRLGDAMIANFYDDAAGGFWGNTVDPNAGGAFLRRRKPYEDEALAVRALTALGAAGRPGPRDGEAIATTLRRLADPAAIEARGRLLGEFLLAAHEARVSSAHAGNP